MRFQRDSGRGGFGGGGGRSFGGGRRFDHDRGFERDDTPKPINVGEEYDVEITEVGSRGDGIARVKNFVVFVNEGKKGEKVKIKITEVRNRFAIGEKVGEASGETTKEKPEETTEESSEDEPKEEASEEPKEEVKEEPKEEVKEEE